MSRPLIAVFTALLIAAPAAAQDARSLSVGQTLSGTLTSDSPHDFTVRLGAEYFVYGDVNQIDVDVVVAVLAPDGEEMARFDDPARGPEPFQFTTEEEGSYTIRVTAFEEQKGGYAVTLRLAEPVATDPEARVDQLMTRFTGSDTPGGVVGVVRGGEIAFQKAYGMASLEYGVPHRVETPTNIGSVTKQFTAMAILLLQSDGLLSVDDDIREYIPELPDFGVTITLKNMLNHATGYRELYNFLPMSGRDGEDLVAREEAIRIIQRQPELQAQPNTEFNYNNTGFILLATVVERVSGMTFPDFMKERIFQPLGMNDTRVKYVQGEIIPSASKGYVPGENGGWRAVRDLGASAGAGGIYTTFPDMAQWMANYRDATVGGRAAVDAITTPNILANGDTTTYGLGMGITKVRGLKVFTHTGGDVAHRTFFSYFPEIDGGVFISSNASNFTGSIAGAVTNLFFEEYMEAEEEDDAASEEGAGEALMPVERLEAIAGDWIIEVANLPTEFLVEDGRLFAVPQGQRRVSLHATSDSSMASTQPAVTIVFHFEDDGSVNTATFTQGQSVPMRRIEESALTAEDMEAFEGRYYSRELEVWLEVRREEPGEDPTAEESDDAEPRLVLHRLRGDPIPLAHGEDLAFTGAFPFAQVEFERAGNGEVTGLRAGSGRTKGVLFERR